MICVQECVASEFTLKEAEIITFGLRFVSIVCSLTSNMIF